MDGIGVSCSLRADFAGDGSSNGDGTYVLGLATSNLGSEVVVAASLSNHRTKVYR